METPHSYAAHLATYIASPLKIEKLVALEFDHVPPLHEIAKMRLRVERAAKRGPSYWCKDPETHDGEDYRPRSLVKPDPTRVTRPNKPRANYVPVTERPPVSTPAAVREIILKVADQFGLTYDELIGRQRAMIFVLARSTAIRLIRDRMWQSGEHRHTITQIGCFFGNRDHSTISYALDHFRDYLRHYPQVREAYELLSGELGR